MAALLLAWFLQDDPAELVRKLDDDRPEVRAAAEAALAKMGEAAAEALEEGLKSPSPEICGRTRTLLLLLPSRRMEALRSHPAYPEFERMWNAIVEGCVRKRPVPEGHLPGEPLVFVLEEEPSELDLDGLIAAMLEDGRMALDHLALIVGQQDPPEEGLVPTRVLLEPMSRLPSRAELIGRIAAAGADAVALEEIAATLLQIECVPSIRWFLLTPKDQDRILVLLAAIRNRPGRPEADPAKAVDRLARGPWMEGLADALGRAFANDPGAPEYLRAELEGIDPGSSRKTPWTEAAAAFDALFRIDQGLKGRWIDPVRLRPAKPALPREAPDPGRADAAMVARVRALGPLPPAAERVLLTILPTLPQDDSSDLSPRLLRELCLRVVERVESGE